MSHTVVVNPAMDEDRQPKQDRSRITRSRLLESAVTCLAREGWTAATMAVIAKEAGMSRGAVQHHFPTREDLITAALEHTFAQRTAALEAIQLTEVDPAERVHHVVEILVECQTDVLFKAALQIWTAAAADPALRDQLVPLERRWARSLHQMAVRLLDVDDSDADLRALIQATLDLARGLGLADVLSDDSKRRAHVVAAWSAQLSSAIEARASS